MPKVQQKEIEQYEHKGKKRLNNPPVGLVTPDTDQDKGKKTYSFDPHIDPELKFDSKRDEIEKLIDEALSLNDLNEIKTIISELKKRQAAYLNWAGKAERTSFDIMTVSLHVHERIDPRTIIEAVLKREGKRQTSLFEFTEENPPIREAIEFYKHKHNWSNRLIAGDSLLVMNSLLEKEGMSGKVQMIYIDPPYGIKYSSNFQPFVNKTNVTDRKDEDLTQEPEMIKAFRDTWELGIHSYLTYLRDRLILARELMNDTGSIFIQIGDENIHLVRCVMDEIFGSENFISQIAFRTAWTRGAKYLDNIYDTLLWYGKDKNKMKYRPLFIAQSSDRLTRYDWIETEDGEMIQLSREQIEGYEPMPKGKRYFLRDLTSQGESPSGNFQFEFDGNLFTPRAGRSWSTNLEGMIRLKELNRIQKKGKNIFYKQFFEDYPVSPINNIWEDTAKAGFFKKEKNIYVVQTPVKVIERCLLLSTDPGDLVFDPTCGSGTTSYVAEKWGRRWITCDTSRVAITLARQRLMTALFDYYKLAYPNEGVDNGFKYNKISHVTLGDLAKDEPLREENLIDQPILDNSKARVSGPFTVEAVPAPIVKNIDEIMVSEEEQQILTESFSRSGETLRQAEWRDELLNTGIRGKGGQKIEFSRVEILPGTRWLQAEAETKDNQQRVVISFGSEYAPLEQRQVALAIEESQKLVPKPDIVIFAAFQFDPEASKDIDETNWPGITLLKVQMNADLLTDDLKKKRSSNESFWLIGQPDIKIEKIEKGKEKEKYQVEVLGFDYYNTRTGNIESGGKEKIAMWMLDTDYDGRSLFPRQVFFAIDSSKEGWLKLAKSLKAKIDENLIEAYTGTKSLPFESHNYKRIAIKIIDDRGIESLKIIEVE